MKNQADILSLALQQPGLSQEMTLISEEKTKVQNLFNFRLQRYAYPQSWPVEDIGMVYFTPRTAHKPASIELRYCLVGNQYCHNPSCKNAGCQLADKTQCTDKSSVVDVISISYQPGLLDTFSQKALVSIFNAQQTKALAKTISPCTKSKLALEQMIHVPYEGILKDIFLQSKAMELLIYSSDQFINNNQDERFGCRFLTHDEDREKIIQAKNILLAHLDSPITIKELARKVAMNECYLKKGFKAMFGTTVYDYFQKERMEKAKSLLYDRGLSVSEVAVKMGYSCISHFSTAFKKHTGLKPCELLR
jgi:AraC-like DNA-binding protein